jgi:hypothetical protein
MLLLCTVFMIAWTLCFLAWYLPGSRGIGTGGGSDDCRQLAGRWRPIMSGDVRRKSRAPYVSTGHPPSARQVQATVDEAYRLYRTEASGAAAQTYPALARVSRRARAARAPSPPLPERVPRGPFCSTRRAGYAGRSVDAARITARKGAALCGRCAGAIRWLRLRTWSALASTGSASSGRTGRMWSNLA